MGLSSCRMAASIAVSDMVRASQFYEGRLGLSAAKEQPDGSRIYVGADGASLHIYESPDHAGKVTATVATWFAADLEQMVDELTANGVTFELYDEPPLVTDGRGIASTGDGRVAWFRDPDGNTFAIEQ